MADPPPAPPARQCPPTIYRSAAGEQAIRSLYDKVLAVLPYEHEERFVETSYGSAHVLVCGPAAAAAQPLVVWHGMGAPAPFILRMLEPLVLSQRFRIYVPDLPYQAGSRTEDALLDPTTHDNGKWCVEVLRGLALLAPPQAGSAAAAPTPPLHVGVSFGAAVIIDLAAVAPEAIRGAVLLVPGGLIPVSLTSFLLRIVLPSLLYLLLPCSFTARLALSGMCDEPVPADWELIPLTWKHVVRRPELPGGHGGFPPDDLARLAAPTFVICAERDVFWPGKAAAAAAAAALPDCQTAVIPDARHLPSRRKMEEANRWILDFFLERGLL